MLKLLRGWLQAGVMEEGGYSETVSGTPQGGVISPLLSNIYLHFLDSVWQRQCAEVGTLVRYADDFVVLCRSREASRGGRAKSAHHLRAPEADAAPGEDADK